MNTILDVNNLRLAYRTRTGEETVAVDGVSFSLNKGDILGIAGESGCGKSTLMWGCMNLCRPPLYFVKGDVALNGASLRTLDTNALRRSIHGKRISLIPQGAINALNPTRKIKHQAADMIIGHNNALRKKEIIAMLHDRFTHLGMDAARVLDAYPFALSGGMRQRAAIGISTLLNPQVVIADEPTSALDVTMQQAVIELLLRLVSEEIIDSMIFITHELPLLSQLATSVAVMYAGQFVEYGSAQQVLRNPRHPYSRTLMASADISDAPCGTLPETPPDLCHPIDGCSFAPRCFAVCEACRHQAIPLQNRNGTLVRCIYA